MPLVFQYFPQSFQELSQEITYHPQLQEKLQWDENSDLGAEGRMAIVAAYCQVVLDGYYDMNDLDKLADLLVHRLRAMRTPLILLPPGSSTNV